MYNQNLKLESRYITPRITTAIIKKRKSELNLDDFDKLLDFEQQKKIKVIISIKPNNELNKKEIMVLLKQNFLADKDSTEEEQKEIIEEKKQINKSTEPLDFSMFDDLMNDFEEKLTIKKESPKKNKKYNVQENLEYLKKEIKYYEGKLDDVYKLDNIETEELQLLELKRKVDELREAVNKNTFDSLSDYKFSFNNDLVDILYYCKKEIEEIESILNNKQNKVTDIQIENKIDKNIEIQKEFIKQIDDRLTVAAKKIKSKLHLCMLKRMMFNLFKMTAGVYLAESTKHDGLKIMVGSFLIINSISGIKEAISLKEEKVKYYKYSDYTKTHLSRNENIILASDILGKSVQNIDELKKEFKKKFEHYKEYIDDYEEIYFKLDKLKEFISQKQEELCELSMSNKNKIKIMELNV